MTTTVKKLPPIAYQVAMERDPEVVLAEAHKAAAALKRVIDSKKKKIVINGELYLRYEDWQTLGRFYGITAGTEWTKFSNLDGVKGFEAGAKAMQHGEAISHAQSRCMSDEPKWTTKPLFQMESQAQTRACAKSLRNVLSWVVVLAGYQPTPAEEIEDQDAGEAEPKPEPKPRRQPAQQKTIEPQYLEASLAGFVGCKTAAQCEQYWGKEMDSAKKAGDTKWMAAITKAKNDRKAELRDEAESRQHGEPGIFDNQ